MRKEHGTALVALAAAGALWGLTVPLSKLSLGWLGPDWLTFARFAVAAPLLALAGRRGLRHAFTPRILAVGGVGFGAVIMLQNAGLERTSVSHAAVLVGVVPVLVALIGASLGHGRARPVGWSGYAIALGGIALISGTGASGASPRGDLLVLASAALSALFIVAQPRLLAGRDAAAVTAVEFAAGALIALPLAALTEAGPSAPADLTPGLALVALSLAGTLLPFWLFAYGQARVPSQLAGAYMNLEPVVGAAVGWAAFDSSAATPQIAGALAVVLGIVLSTLPSHPAEAGSRGGWRAGERPDGNLRLVHRRRQALEHRGRDRQRRDDSVGIDAGPLGALKDAGDPLQFGAGAVHGRLATCPIRRLVRGASRRPSHAYPGCPNREALLVRSALAPKETCEDARPLAPRS